MKVKILISLKSFEARQLSRIRQNCRIFNEYKRIVMEKKNHGNPQAERLVSGYNICWDEQSSSLVSIALPKKQSNYTVLRSPHIDKKSRDQFELRTNKQLIIISTEIKQIREKLFHLKFHEMPGVQMTVVFQTKTRLSNINEGTLALLDRARGDDRGEATE